MYVHATLVEIPDLHHCVKEMCIHVMYMKHKLGQNVLNFRTCLDICRRGRKREGGKKGEREGGPEGRGKLGLMTDGNICTKAHI